MKKYSRLLALLLTLALCAVPVLGAFAEAAATDAPTETAEATATADPNEVMATVNGVSITRSTVENIASNLMSSYSQYGYDTTDASLVTMINQYAMDYAIQLELMSEKAVEWGFDQFTDEEKAQMEADNTTQWNSIVDQYVTNYGGLATDATDEDKAAARLNILATLESMGYTEAVLLENTMESAKYDKVQAEMVKGAEVTDEEIQAAFDEKVKSDEASYKDDVGTYEYMTQYYGQTSYYVPEGYRGVTHILLEVDDTLLSNYQTLNAKLEEQEDEADKEAEGTGEAEATDEAAAETVDPAATTDATEPTATPDVPVTQEEVDAARDAIIASVQPTIDEINQKLAQGVPFADLVAEYGTDPGMQSDPAKTDGYSVHMDSVVWDPAFVTAAFTLQNIGDVSEPTVGSYGVHIVCYVRDVPSGAVELTDEIKSSLRDELISSKENDLFNAKMDEFKAASVITYTPAGEALLPTATEEPAAQ